MGLQGIENWVATCLTIEYLTIDHPQCQTYALYADYLWSNPLNVHNKDFSSRDLVQLIKDHLWTQVKLIYCKVTGPPHKFAPSAQHTEDPRQLLTDWKKKYISDIFL